MNRSKRNIRVYSPVIFVSGPYTGRTNGERARHIQEADMAARSIALLGLDLGLTVRVLTPHNNTRCWDNNPRFTHDYFYRVCCDWILDAVDAIYFLGPSPGANLERALAEAIGIPVLRTMEEVQAWLLEWKESRETARVSSG